MRFSTKFLGTLAGLALSTGALAASKSNEWLIRTTLAAPTAQELTSRFGVAVARVEHVADDLYKVVLVESETESDVDLKALLSEREDATVTRIQRNFVYRPLADNPPIQAPSSSPARGPDPRVSSQWGLAKSNAQAAWSIQRGDRNVVVAVIDTGIDYNHEDLRSSLWRNPNEIAGNNVDDDNNGYVDDVLGWDFSSNDALPYDLMSAMRFDGNPGHGTHCAGVIGGSGENAIGISGIAPGISIMGLRFISESGQGTTDAAIQAIRYAVANGAKVLSNSWGGEAGDEDDTELQQAIQDAQDAGVLLIFAAGNGRNGVGYSNDTDPSPAIPASYDHDAIISVAATDVNNALGAFSNFGTRTVDIAAPGVKIMSSVPNNGYEDSITVFGLPIAEWSGTSMAAPHVAGVAALIWSEYPHLTAAEVKARILNSATPVAGLATKVKVGGILNAQRALQ